MKSAYFSSLTTEGTAGDYLPPDTTGTLAQFWTFPVQMSKIR